MILTRRVLWPVDPSIMTGVAYLHSAGWRTNRWGRFRVSDSRASGVREPTVAPDNVESMQEVIRLHRVNIATGSRNSIEFDFLKLRKRTKPGITRLSSGESMDSETRR